MSATGILTVLGALGSAATIHGYKSRLSVSPDASSVTSNGLAMPIKVSNDGILSVNDVSFSCGYKRALTASGTEFGDIEVAGFPSQTIPEIVAGHPVTLFCQGGSPIQAISINAPLNSVELEITVNFRPSFYLWQKSDTFKLTGVGGPDGSFHWMPHQSFKLRHYPNQVTILK